MKIDLTRPLLPMSALCVVTLLFIGADFSKIRQEQGKEERAVRDAQAVQQLLQQARFDEQVEDSLRRFRKHHPLPTRELGRIAITKDHYALLRNGMTHAQVSELLVLQPTTISADPGFTESYTWKNPDTSFLRVSFEDGRMTDKFDCRLK